jgi:predicted amidophosphoribosyltransferase
VRGVKAGHPVALHHAALLLAQALADHSHVRRLRPGAILAVPGHRCMAAGSSPLEDLCRRLSSLLPEFRPLPGALVRRRTIRSSAASTSRPTVGEHLETLAVGNPRLGRYVILVDDVYTLGSTTTACHALLRDNGAPTVIVAALARTKLR